MWPQNYAPVANSLVLSTLAAAAPIAVLLALLAVARRPAWLASLAGLIAAAALAGGIYGMPADRLFASIGYGAAFGLFPIGWVVFTAILLYRVSVNSGKFEILKNSIANLTTDRRLQALLIAFAFGAFIEGAAGFGTPVAVAGAMLVGLGFSPFYAAAICLLANTAPVAFGSIAIPITTLAGTTGLPIERLSAGVGRICAPVSLFVPAYLILVMSGWKGLRAVFPAAAICGIAFAGTQFFVSNFVGPQLTDILASMCAMGALVVLIRFWRPESATQTDSPAHEFDGNADHAFATSATGAAASAVSPAPRLQTVTHGHRPSREIALAWMPYILLVIFVLAWGELQPQLNKTNMAIPWPLLHNTILRIPPAVAKPSPYAAIYTFGWLSASGTACLIAAVLSAVVVGLKPRQFVNVIGDTARQLAKAEFTLAAVLALAFLMNYSGATGTLGLAFAATGAVFPFFSALLGWLGVFLTGSDTSANALFGTLQVVTAHKLSMNPVLMASANSSGGVMGKMISLTSIAVAAAATSMKRGEEALLFRFTLRHSVLLASVIGLIAMFYAYVMPAWAP